jgi:hypothetical protein
MTMGRARATNANEVNADPEPSVRLTGVSDTPGVASGHTLRVYEVPASVASQYLVREHPTNIRAVVEQQLLAANFRDAMGRRLDGAAPRILHTTCPHCDLAQNYTERPVATMATCPGCDREFTP